MIEQIKASKLRGRGGAGFLTGNKWEFLRKAVSDQKFIICNADEGDPGAYMNRNEIESDPHALLEGMIIGGYVMGATSGIIYVRAEYPLAVHRLNRAIEQARDYGLLGDNILGRGFNFDIQLVEGAGAFVCGEETALIASLEGEAGRPRPRPPFPAQKRPVGQADQHQQRRDLVQHRPDHHQGPGLVHRDRQRQERRNQGLLAGRQGAQHRPGGDAAGHAAEDLHLRHRRRRRRTAAPSRRCRPAGRRAAAFRSEMFDTPVDYESLAQLGSIMGSGGMVVMDEDNCMVDVARYFIEFTHSESCGKCIPCRVGLNKACAS